MCHALLLLTLICYIYACFGCELIAKEKELYSEAAGDVIELYFPNLVIIMFTLAQLVVFDNLLICRALIVSRPVMAIYFISFFMFVSIAFMNLVTATIIEASFKQTEEDEKVDHLVRAEIFKKRVPKLLEVFKIWDADGSGDITLEEVKDAPEFVKEELNKLIVADDLVELFHILDGDGSERICLDEFFDGIMRIGTGQIEFATLRIQKNMDFVLKRVIKEFDKVNASLSKSEVGT
jgi:hypothetical protein